MKRVFKFLLATILLMALYYGISMILMNNNPYVVHYYGFDDYNQAKEKKALLNSNVSFSLEGFTKEQEDVIRKKIFIYTTKSYYQEIYGFLISFSKEDKNLQRIYIELKNKENIADIYDAELQFNKEYIGLLYGAEFDVPRAENEVILVVIQYQNHKPVKLGEMKLRLN